MGGSALPSHDYEWWAKSTPAHSDSPSTDQSLKIEGVSFVCEHELSTSKQKRSQLSDPGPEAEHLAKRKPSHVLEMKPMYSLRVKRCLLYLCMSPSANAGGFSVPK